MDKMQSFSIMADWAWPVYNSIPDRVTEEQNSVGQLSACSAPEGATEPRLPRRRRHALSVRPGTSHRRRDRLPRYTVMWRLHWLMAEIRPETAAGRHIMRATT